MKAILGQKVGMTQAWDDKGRLVSATVIFAEPNTVLSRIEDKTVLGVKSAGKTNKSQEYLAKKIDSKRGIRVKEIVGLTVEGDNISVGQFQVGDPLTISGVTKGKGFAGTIKRHNFHRGPVTHGSHNIRQPGSIGAQRPQRVPKGQKMAGQMGNKNLSVRGSKVLSVDEENNLLVVSGAVPGPAKGHIIVRSSR